MPRHVKLAWLSMKSEERLLALAVPIGFVAFTLPLLYSDTKHLWRPVPDEPPPPPPYVHHDLDDDTPNGKFRQAVTSGDLTAAKDLIGEHGVKLVNENHWHGNTPLFEAARAGHRDVVEWLVEQGAEVDHANEWGDAPVNEAATMGHFDIVWYLAEHGANLQRTQDSMHTG